MRYCKRCVCPENHPLNITFDDAGICSGCRIHEARDRTDWEEKSRALEEILLHYRNRAGSHYDCVIPVSGNGDSFYTVDTVKNRYRMNPLLVTYNTHFNTKVGVRNLARLIAKLDCDHLMRTVSPDTAKRITRITLEKIGEMYWHVIVGSKTFPLQVATRLKIPLIIRGVNDIREQVGVSSHGDEADGTGKFRIDTDMFAGEDPNLFAKDLQAFTWPADDELEGVRELYLSDFIRWDVQRQTEEMIIRYGCETSEQERTFDTYETIYCRNNAGVHDYIRYFKYGYGKATDHACRDIRLGRMTREQGIELVQKYDAVKPRDLEMFLDWVKMTEEEFMTCINRFRDPRIWEEMPDGSWVPRDSVLNHIDDEGVDDVRLAVNDPRKYIQTPLLEPENEDYGYILMGRTYLDEKNYKAIEG